MDKDSKLIFENYLSSKNDIVSEADEKKLEDESSLWFWFKAFDPTGISSWPDFMDAWSEVMKRPKDIGPWAMLLLNGFLALPNFGLLAAGVGAGGWAALRGLSKAAIKGGEKEAINVAEKVLKMATESKWFREVLKKFGKALEERGVANKNMIDIYMDIITSGNFAKLGAKESVLAGATKEVIGDITKSKLKGTVGQVGQYIGRGVKEGYPKMKSTMEGEATPKPSTINRGIKIKPEELEGF